MIDAANLGLGMARSYYVATAPARPREPALGDAVSVDVCVIGGGVTGLSAALHAAEAGATVRLLEAGRIGWGASGRNGGQVIPGWRKGAADLVALFGHVRARALFDLAIAGRGLLEELILRHGIDCDWRPTGHILAAIRPRDLAWMRAEVTALRDVMGYGHARVLDRAEMAGEVAASYHGGLLDGLGGHLHPLKFTLGLADAAVRAGAILHEDSPAITLSETGGRVTVATRSGVVTARHAVIACDALLGGLSPRLGARIMPIANYQIATEPFEAATDLILKGRAISDSRFVVNYYRVTPDHRLIFGGGERYTPTPPGDIAGFVRPHMLKLFPSTAGLAITHAWGGMVSVTTTRLPDVGRLGNIFHAQGYSGMGVILSALAGEAIARAITASAERFELMASVQPPPFPGGTRLRAPLHVLGMLWYALRDRL